MKKYELTFNPELIQDENEGVYGVSLVETPAIGVQAFLFSEDKKNKIKFKFSNDDEQIIVSPILIPNQWIYRDNVYGSEGMVTVTAETIKQLQQNFFNKNHNHNTSLEHSGVAIEGIYIYESWLIEDFEMDKAKALGFDPLPKGTWMVSMKINNKDVWDNIVKTGQVKGLSIDALLFPVEQKEFNFSKQKQMKKNLFKAKFAKALKRVLMAENLKPIKIDEDLTVYTEGEDLAVGVKVFNEFGDPMMDSEFQYEGKLFKVNADGVIETAEEINENDPEINYEFSDEELVEIVEEIKEEIIEDYSVKVAELEKEIVDLKAKLAIYEEAEVEAIEMKRNRPARKGVTAKLAKQTKVNSILGAVQKNLK